ncbi:MULTISPECIES: DUF4892 domain-containing protein [Pseudomonas]|uniref:DUF4892 domain-containing protein n=1 Tax=Pseudomonas tritici TaxID=2745518 RepID=A0A8H9YT41_9PSED|nr:MULTISPECIES: DUF4892 domain-containing protein [Pseudomonas]MBP2875168.1 DUF4892 domain-containing protein [Pseudomonas sp. SWRI144]QXH85810.1 DUF4892 domain-containing protein [Pseudomonas tritici]CRM62263.1 hypothetical protein [Pseudomonas sp. 24 E 1]
MSVRNGCIRVLGLSLLSPLVFAADLPGSQDLPAVARQVDAQIVDYRPAEEKERIYPMGAIRKISGQLRYEGQAIARGQATAITYELPAEHSASAAFTTTREALQEKGAQLLFWCKARDCGESSLWANEIFGNAKLVGADSQQEYLLLRLAEPQANSLVALYGITRGNRRAYLHVEQLDASAPLGDLLPTSATLLRELKSTGELGFPALAGAPDATWLTLISRGLNLDTTLRVSLTGPSAEAWRQGLIDNGVRAARLESGTGDAKGLHVHLIR